MDSENTSSRSKMDKIRIVVEYSGLSEDKRANYLKKNRISQKTLKAYQEEAAKIMGFELPKPKTRCEELIEELRNENENARRDAVRALGNMRHRATSAISSIIESMHNDSIDFVRSWSAWALTRISPRNPAVIDGFLKSLTEDEESLNTRNWCIVGLSVSDSDEVEEKLLDILHTGKPFAQFASIEVLVRVKNTSLKFVEGLKIALESENASLRKLAEIEISKFQDQDSEQGAQ